MKTYILLLATICCFYSCKQKYDVVRRVPKQKLTPYNTVWLKENLFIYRSEVTNWEYYIFLENLKKRDSLKYESMKPFSINFTNDTFDLTWHSVNYLNHAWYVNYPVTGVSYIQAKSYCEWLTERVNLNLNSKLKIIKINSDSVYNYPKLINYRLPTKDEWMFAALSGLDINKYPLGYEVFIDRKGRMVTNTRESYNLNKELYQSESSGEIRYLWAAESGKPNKFGIYNMLGNASEIVADSLVMGLSYVHYLDGSVTKGYIFDKKIHFPYYDTTQTYIFRDIVAYKGLKYDVGKTTKYFDGLPWQGFRCICEVLKK